MKTEYLVLGGLALLALIFIEKSKATNVSQLPGGLTLTSPAGSTLGTAVTAGASLASDIAGLFQSSQSSAADQVGGTNDPAYDPLTGTWAY